VTRSRVVFIALDSLIEQADSIGNDVKKSGCTGNLAERAAVKK
jgi:hypothetical protein